MDIAFTVHLPVDTGSVPFVRGLCRQALEHLDVERTVVDEVSLALTEACANVVQHAGEHAGYEVAVSVDDRLCRISVVDDGAGFDPATLPEGDERTPLEDGRGLLLMQALVDRLDFRHEPDGRHRVTLEKRLTPHPPLRLVDPA
ncbi:ATP-binding protein [Geodermatophilus poikilotrophus]|uniref:Serine/threonine-protein kinase RsbW n=1 Tax=Geodermatophilus poikilotrophus TaxID=1333667 RepID=A0A1I0CU91_9ACTN|nr:ATP-binding protein [Geodermatophilus poikilotrophus]SET23274.1 serine/threonine-protein kinase RsbW [Geodermatophilus poikilotrophus]